MPEVTLGDQFCFILTLLPDAILSIDYERPYSYAFQVIQGGLSSTHAHMNVDFSVH